MLRFIGYLLAAVSGAIMVATSLMLIYKLFIADDYDQVDGDELSVIALALVASSLVFIYVRKTGFGESKLKRVQEELEILKIKQEIKRLKNNSTIP